MYKKRAVFRRSILKVENDGTNRRLKDCLVAEEPFTLVWSSSDGHSERLSSTMRTPGNDLALAAGSLFSTGLIFGLSELAGLSFCMGGSVNELNRLKASLRLPASVINERLAHRPSASLPQSACGMCGLDDLASPGALLAWSARRYSGKPWEPTREILDQALGFLEDRCPLFKATGASHACIIVNAQGELLSVGEDVGRHNACDKAIGNLILDEVKNEEAFCLPPKSGVLFSSRLSFELACKALGAGASWMAAVGAPTHLAVDLAQECRVPLLGFLSSARYNCYS